MAGKLEDLAALFGIARSRPLDLAAPMHANVGRIGYEEEGLRLTLSIESPYQFNAEVKLSRADAEWLIARLRAELDDPRNANLPKGRPEATEGVKDAGRGKGRRARTR